MRIICDTCNESVYTYDAWIHHLVSNQHKAVAKTKLISDSFTPDENKCTLLISGLKSRKKNGGGGRGGLRSRSARYFDQTVDPAAAANQGNDNTPISPLDLLYHYDQFGMISDFVWDESLSPFAFIQFDDAKNIPCLVGDRELHNCKGRQLTAQLKSKYKSDLLYTTMNGSGSPSPNKERSRTSSITSNDNQLNNEGIKVGLQLPPQQTISFSAPVQIQPNTKSSNDSSSSAVTQVPHYNNPVAIPEPKAVSSSKLEVIKGIAQIDPGPSKNTGLRKQTAKSPPKIQQKEAPRVNTNVKPGGSSNVVATNKNIQQTAVPKNVAANANNGGGGPNKSPNTKNLRPAEAAIQHFQSQHLKLCEEIARQTKNRNLDEQFHYFQRKITLSPDGFNKRKEIIRELKQIVGARFNKCQMYEFGSFVTRLGDPDSDIDIYVNLYGTPRSKTFNKEATPIGQNKTKVLKDIKNLLYTACRNKYKIIPIFNARVPIMRIIDYKTNIQLDLSFENLLSVQNSQLIEFYTKLDPRVFPLLLLVRYWAKFHDLSGSTQLKNYTLTLMVLVYLTRSDILPSIYELQTTIMGNGYGQEFKVDGWNAAFVSNFAIVQKYMRQQNKIGPQIEFISPTTKIPTAKSILQLSIGFFEMYSNFDNTNKMICSLTSEFLTKSIFEPGYEEELPETLNLYKDWAINQDLARRLKISTPFCIQDPFDLSFNVGSCASTFIIEDFIWCCKDTIERIRTLLDQESTNPSSPVLFAMFVLKPDQEKKRRFRQRDRRLRTQLLGGAADGGIENDDAAFEIDQTGYLLKFKPESARLSKIFIDKLSESFINANMEKLYALWLNFMIEFFVNVLPVAYKMDIISETEEEVDGGSDAANFCVPDPKDKPADYSVNESKQEQESVSEVPSSATSFENLLDVITGGAADTSFSSEGAEISFMDTEEDEGAEKLTAPPPPAPSTVETAAVVDDKGPTTDQIETIQPDVEMEEDIKVAGSRQSKRPLSVSPPGSTANGDSDKTMPLETKPFNKSAKTDFQEVQANQKEPQQNGHSQAATEQEEDGGGAISALAPLELEQPSAPESGPTSTTIVEQLFLQALDLIPSITNYQSAKKIKIIAEGQRNFTISRSQISESIAKSTKNIGNVLEFEGQVTEEILRRYPKIVTSKRPNRSAKPTFIYELIGQVNILKMVENTADLPEFIIELSNNHSLMFCTDILRKRFLYLIPAYITSQLNKWKTSILSAAPAAVKTEM